MPWKVSSKDTFQSHSYSLYFTLFSYVWLVCTVESCRWAFRVGRQLHLCDFVDPGWSSWEGRGNIEQATRPGGTSAQATSGVAQQQRDQPASRSRWLPSLKSQQPAHLLVPAILLCIADHQTCLHMAEGNPTVKSGINYCLSSDNVNENQQQQKFSTNKSTSWYFHNSL